MICIIPCVVLVIVIIVMDLGLLYGSFVMDDRELILHSTPGASGVYRDDIGSTHCAITSFQNADPDIERDALSINQRLFDSEGIKLLGIMVVAGPSQEVIYVLVPDSTTSTSRPGGGLPECG